MVRLNKYLADAGLGSRRRCDGLIQTGRITVDGVTVTELGTKVGPDQTVAVEGKPLKPQRLVYWLINKPSGYISTNFDPGGKPKVLDLVPHVPERVYTVGRLDEASEGLVLLTNDGDLALKLTHPRYGIEKTYEVLVAGKPTEDELQRMTRGIRLSEGTARARHVRRVGVRGDATLLEIVLSEGKNREIRRMLAKLGHKVMELRRIAIGPIKIDRLKRGKCRRLGEDEVNVLKRITAKTPQAKEEPPGSSRRGRLEISRGRAPRPASPNSGQG
jgi:23S rRNA pseudouridine2605 synthase